MSTTTDMAGWVDDRGQLRGYVIMRNTKLESWRIVDIDANGNQKEIGHNDYTLAEAYRRVEKQLEWDREPAYIFPKGL